ncbi:MAG: Repeat family [Acidobacteria bacterium]|nr:Repeat family [Acidobacteriota bacterium]
MLGTFLIPQASAQEASNSGAGPPDSPPFISAMADQTVDEDSPTLPLRVLYGDAQTPVAELRLLAASSNEKLLPAQNILFNEATQQELVMVPAHDQHGTTTVTLTVENAQGKRASRSFRLTVKPVNDPPSLLAHGPVALLEDDRPQTIPLEVTDPESRPEELTVEVLSSHAALLPQQNFTLAGSGKDRLLSLRPAPDQHGLAVVVLTVRDPQGAQSRLELTVRVQPVNDPPRLGLIADQRLFAGRLFAGQALDPMAFTLTDDETPPAELVLEGSSSNPLLVPESNILFGGSGELRTLSLRPARNLTGSALITVKARDRERLESSASFLLTVDRENAPPEISGLSNITLEQDQPAGPLPFTITDPDGRAESVRLEAASSNPALVPLSNLQLSGTGHDRTLTLGPRPGASGTAEVTLTATDSDGAQRQASFLVNVRPAALRPIALAFPLSVIEDTPAEILLKGENPSARPLAYAVLSAPQKGVLTGVPPRLTYTPHPNASGSDAFQFKVSDGPLESLPATVAITIQEINDPPAISSIASRRTEPGKSTGPIRFAVEDLETAASKLQVTGRSSNPDLIPDAGILLTGLEAVREVTIHPAPGRTGAAVITLTVKDSGGLSASTAFELNVAEASGAPKADPQSVVTPEDVPVAISLRAGDGDGPSFRFAIVDAPVKGTLSGFPPNLVYRPKPNQTGEDRFTFKVSNTTGESPAAAVEVLILPVNDPPIARSQSLTVNEDTALAIELAATDADKDPLTYEVASFPTKGKLSGSRPG